MKCTRLFAVVSLALLVACSSPRAPHLVRVTAAVPASSYVDESKLRAAASAQARALAEQQQAADAALALRAAQDAARASRAASGQRQRSQRPAPTYGALSGLCDRPSTCPQLRQCENGGSYAHGTSPQYDGAYQFADKSQWGMTPTQQDAHADQMYAASGRAPWPKCGRFLR